MDRSWHGDPHVTTSAGPNVSTVNVVTSSCSGTFGQWRRRTLCACGSISHMPRGSNPALSKPRSKPPMPAKRLTNERVTRRPSCRRLDFLERGVQPLLRVLRVPPPPDATLIRQGAEHLAAARLADAEDFRDVRDGERQAAQPVHEPGDPLGCGHGLPGAQLAAALAAARLPRLERVAALARAADERIAAH